MTNEGAEVGGGWYVRGPHGTLGPFSAAQLRELARTGNLDPGSLVRKGEDGPWNKAAHVKGLGFGASAHDVFVSYSNRNKAQVDGVIHCLEEQGIRCWVAPRDIRPGANWGEAIIRGIESCRVLVLVLSKHSNASQQILQEVERAVAKGLIVVPFRIEDVPVSSKLELYVGARHWLDAFDGDLEAHATELAHVLRGVLDSVPVARGARGPGPRAPRQAAAPRRTPLLVGASVGVLALAGLGWFWASRGGEKEVQAGGTEASPVASAPEKVRQEKTSSPKEPIVSERESRLASKPPPPKTSEPEPQPPEPARVEPEAPRVDPLETEAAAVLTRLDAVTGPAAAYAAWSRVRALASGKPSPEQTARLADLARSLAPVAVQTFDARLRDQQLAAELDALHAWTEEAGCALLASQTKQVYAALAESLSAELGSAPRELDALLPSLRGIESIAERDTCGHPGEAKVKALLARGAEAVEERLEVPATPEEALRVLLVVDRFAAELEPGAVQDSVLSAPEAALSILAQALQPMDSLPKTLSAYAEVADLSAGGRFQLLGPRLRALAEVVEHAIETEALGETELVGLKRAGVHLERFAKELPEESPLDGATAGRVGLWCAGLQAKVDAAAGAQAQAVLDDIQVALNIRDWKRAESMARDLAKEAPKDSGAAWMATTMQAEAMFGSSGPERFPPIEDLFKKAVNGTQEEPSLHEVCARAAVGLTHLHLIQMNEAIQDARAALRRDDVKAQRTEESKFVKAEGAARWALQAAFAAGAEPEDLRQKVNTAVATWNRDIGPNLKKGR